jgi:hypothetical protein
VQMQVELQAEASQLLILPWHGRSCRIGPTSL